MKPLIVQLDGDVAHVVKNKAFFGTAPDAGADFVRQLLDAVDKHGTHLRIGITTADRAARDARFESNRRDRRAELLEKLRTFLGPSLAHLGDDVALITRSLEEVRAKSEDDGLRLLGLEAMGVGVLEVIAAEITYRIAATREYRQHVLGQLSTEALMRALARSKWDKYVSSNLNKSQLACSNKGDQARFCRALLGVVWLHHDVLDCIRLAHAMDVDLPWDTSPTATHRCSVRFLSQKI